MSQMLSDRQREEARMQVGMIGLRRMGANMVRLSWFVDAAAAAELRRK